MTTDDKGDKGFVVDEQDLGDIGDYTPEELADDKTDWKAKALEAQGIARRRTTALKKAKDAIEAGKKPPEKKADDVQVPKPGELDYGQKAFLVASGFKTADEQKVIQDAMKATGATLEDVVQNEFVLGKIDEMRKAAATKEATPNRSDRQQAPARDSVEYWLNKGELPPNTAENRELRQKVVNAKLAKAKGGSTFSDTPVVQ